MTEEATAIIKQIEQLCYELKKMDIEYKVDFCDKRFQNNELQVTNIVYMDSCTEEFVRNYWLCEMYQKICKQNPNAIIDFESFADYIKNSLMQFANEEYFSGKFTENRL